MGSTMMRFVWLALFTGCAGGADTGGGGVADRDGDGTPDAEDCAPDDPASYPGAHEFCDGVDQDCDGAIDETFDLDGDGVLADEADCRALDVDVDCDDLDPDIHPGADEACDQLDNDCDGIVDDAADADGDGYGACQDCNDADPYVLPGAYDACDGVDNDCSGLADEPWDEDGDGFSPCSGDCDDGDPQNAPNGVEICDGHDNDCDAEVDEGFDVDADTFTTCDGDCDDANADVNPGAVEICDEIDDDCDGAMTDDADVDQDGYTICQGDCDDDESRAHPAGTETCDSVDNDCSGVADEMPECYTCTEQAPYLYCKKSATWDDAHALCQAFGGDLAILGDATEAATVGAAASDVSRSKKWWIGLSDTATEATFLWVDGSALAYDAWSDGQPNETDDSYDCVLLNQGEVGQMATSTCDASTSFICEE